MLRRYKFQIVKPKGFKTIRGSTSYWDNESCPICKLSIYYNKLAWGKTVLDRVGEKGTKEYDFDRSKVKYKGHWLCKHWFKILADVSVVFIRGTDDN